MSQKSGLEQNTACAKQATKGGGDGLNGHDTPRPTKLVLLVARDRRAAPKRSRDGREGVASRGARCLKAHRQPGLKEKSFLVENN